MVLCNVCSQEEVVGGGGERRKRKFIFNRTFLLEGNAP